MARVRSVRLAALILMAAASPIRADDTCRQDEFLQARAKKELAVAAERSGRPADTFLAYSAVIDDPCMRDETLRAKYRAALPKLALDLAKAAEAKGLLYSREPLGIDGSTSAFAWLEAVGEYGEANRVMLKAVRTRPEDLELFRTAWRVDQRRVRGDARTGEPKPYASPPTYRQELQTIALANAETWMKAEEKDAAGLSGSAAAVGQAAANSLEKLKKASQWMEFLPDGDRPARVRAEQRGDTIMKRGDPTFTQVHAKAYYDFAGTSRAKEKLAQLEEKSRESQRAMESAARTMEGAITEKSAAERKPFQKGKDELEQALGF